MKVIKAVLKRMTIPMIAIIFMGGGNLLGPVSAFAMRPDTLWISTYDGPFSTEAGRDGQQTLDGGYIMVGYTSHQGDMDAYLVKTDALGNAVWTKTYGTTGHIDCLIAVCQTSDGGYIAVGYTESFGAGEMDIWLMRITADGDTLWTKTFGGVYSDMGYSVQPTSEGGYIIAGSSYSPEADGFDVYLIKTDGNGYMLWSRTFGVTGRDEIGYSVQQTEDMGYVVAGCTDGQYSDVYVVKTDANGDTIWTRIYGGLLAAEIGYSIQQTTDNGYIIAGSTDAHTQGDLDVCLIKIDEYGDELWFKHYDHGAHLEDVGKAVCQTADGGYIVAGKTTDLENYPDLFLIRTDPDGDTCWTQVWGGVLNDEGWSIQQTADQAYVVIGTTRSFGAVDVDVLLMRLTPDSLLTDDNTGLAYNGNRHLVRQPNSPNLHLVYSFEDFVLYTKSTDAGVNWSALENIGSGIYPAVALDVTGNPCVTWTNDDGALFYGKKAGTTWLYCELYRPITPLDPVVNSPPAMTIGPGDEGIPIVHIIATFTGAGPPDDVTHEVRHYYFDSNNPSATYTIIETAVAPLTPLRRHSPTIIRNEIDNTLHAVWMRVDTICYARKTATGSWVKYGNYFGQDGRNSAYPFVESYGDSIYLVWQNKASPTSPEEIMRGSRHRRQPPRWQWWPHSVTPTTVSLLPVNASGMFTAFMDQEESQQNFDVFFKIQQDDPLTNISQTTAESYYPQASAWFTLFGNHLYTAWLEGNGIPYEIRLKDTFLPYDAGDEIAYLSSFSGDSVVSPYLNSRDGYKPGWQVPIDYGNQQLIYRFPLDPAYLYKAKVIAYHEKTGEWRALCRIDGGNQMVIKYNPHIPETLTFWIPPHLYQDSILEVTLNRVAGDYVSMGQIYVYRYETDSKGNGGPQSTAAECVNMTVQLHVQPSLIVDDFTIAYTLMSESDIQLAIFDASGRKLKTIAAGLKPSGHYRETVAHQSFPQGVYFVRLTAGGMAAVNKVVFAR